MELIYSTGDLQHAQRLAAALAAAGVRNHVSGSHAAGLPGYPPGRTPAAVGVWLVDRHDMQRARQVMRRDGYLPAPSPEAPAALRHRPVWVMVAVALAMAGLAFMLAGSG